MAVCNPPTLVDVDGTAGVGAAVIRCESASTALGNRRGARTTETDFEISRQQFHFVALRIEEDIREDGDRVLAFDDALEQLQFSQQIGLTEVVDGKLRLREEAVLVGDEAFLRFLEPTISSNMT